MLDLQAIQVGDRVVGGEGDTIEQVDRATAVADVAQTQFTGGDTEHLNLRDPFQYFHPVAREGDVAPASQLGENPQLFRPAGTVHACTEELVVGVFTRRGLQVAGFVAAVAQVDIVHFHGQVFGTGEDLPHFFVVGFVHAVAAGFQQSFHQGDVGVGVRQCPIFPHTQHFAGVTIPNFQVGGDGVSGFFDRRPNVPGFADTVAVNVACTQLGNHLGGGNGGNRHILVGVDATRRQPVAQQQVMQRGWVDYAKNVAFVRGFQQHLFQVVERVYPLTVEPLVHGDGVAVAGHGQGGDGGDGLARAAAHGHPNRQAGGHLRRIQVTARDAVLDAAPTGFPHQMHFIQAMVGKEALFLRHSQGSAGSQGHEADFQVHLF